jgi:hypothetical protein
MRYSYKKNGFIVLFAIVFATTGFTSLTAEESRQAKAQSPMDMMDMMKGGGNITDGTMMDDNISLPFKMGVLAMPMMCTTPNQLLGSLSGIFGGMTGGDGNATQKMMMGMMEQQMESSGGLGMQNMTESDMQKAMDLVICIPVMGEEMMQSMMGNGTNNMMSGMMMQ